MKFKELIKNKKIIVGCLIVLIMFGAPAGKIIADNYFEKAHEEYWSDALRTNNLDQYCDFLMVEYEYDEESDCKIYDLNAEIIGWRKKYLKMVAAKVNLSKKYYETKIDEDCSVESFQRELDKFYNGNDEESEYLEEVIDLYYNKPSSGYCGDYEDFERFFYRALPDDDDNLSDVEINKALKIATDKCEMEMLKDRFNDIAEIQKKIDKDGVCIWDDDLDEEINFLKKVALVNKFNEEKGIGTYFEKKKLIDSYEKYVNGDKSGVDYLSSYFRTYDALRHVDEYYEESNHMRYHCNYIFEVVKCNVIGLDAKKEDRNCALIELARVNLVNRRKGAEGEYTIDEVTSVFTSYLNGDKNAQVYLEQLLINGLYYENTIEDKTFEYEKIKEQLGCEISEAEEKDIEELIKKIIDSDMTQE